MSRYDDILTKLRAATEPDFRLDLDVSNALALVGDRWWRFDPLAGFRCPESLTGRLDLALAVFEEKLPDWGWNLSNKPVCFYADEPHDDEDNFDWFSVVAPTGALAVLIILFEVLKAKERQ